ncbi:unnamed protein product [Prorocentrum cordatum]|uniref:Uncharacterized protein n=1 Tax=Prorocentrum cordatum TaxID=2364126 RepID=A0ABN9XB62_9DINO|nr:unnamed protein product [Polarella glacialis]
MVVMHGCPSGELFAAVCGAVPVDYAPKQQARDGEDYLYFMLAGLAEGDFQVWTDCEGTPGCVWDRWPSVSSGNPRAHLWSRVWHVFEDGLTAHKTLGHASFNDIVEGRSAHFERGKQARGSIREAWSGVTSVGRQCSG